MNLLRFDNEAAWIGAIASLWRDRLNTKPGLRMCLPSGTTPAPVYAEMTRSCEDRRVSFARATVFALDEFGGLPHDDPGLTGNTLRRQLIDHVDLRPDAFHALDPDREDLAAHCAAYDAAMGGGVDLMILGIGRNGHLGMNEPGSDAGSVTRRVALHGSTVQASARYFGHQNLPRWGVTVGLTAILGSKEVWILASGETKAAIVERTIRGGVGTDNPASLLRPHPNCWLITDAAAGASLDLPPEVPPHHPR